MKYFRATVCSLLMACAGSISCLAQDAVDSSTPPALIVDPFDSFNKISLEDEQARLDSFAVALMTTPDWVGQIIIYAGRKSCAGEAQARAIRMKKYLVERRGIEWNRVMWRDAGLLEKPYVVFWLARRDYLLPPPVSRADTLSPTEAQIINCKAKRQRRKKR